MKSAMSSRKDVGRPNIAGMRCRVTRRRQERAQVWTAPGTPEQPPGKSVRAECRPPDPKHRSMQSSWPDALCTATLP
eukprot:scaffold51282_cov67-Phaeocystis_antarctica.AAC.2